VIRFRASAIAEIMADGKGEELSVGAKTWLKAVAKEMVYGYEEQISSKYMDKGIQCEQDSIDLYNRVFFTRHQKNEERRTNDWFTGEPDLILPGAKIIDIKTAWSLATFPATVDCVQAIAKKSGYDYQGRVYMNLFDVPEFEVAYCMVTTPEELRRWEQAELHQVDHIDPALRVTRYTIERCEKIEQKMIVKVEAAREYLKTAIDRIINDH
jgi:hypothetical protein